MNVSTTYDSLSVFNNTIKPGDSAFSFEKENKTWLPVPVKTSVNEGHYNYYVQEDTSETVYNEKRNLQPIHHGLGAVINIFV